MISLPLIVALLIVFCSVGKSRILEDSSEKENAFNKSYDDKPLFLTPYLENGDIETARQLSLCGELPNAPPVKSYSGFITVNKTYNSNIFFWFFPSMNEDEWAPVLLWLQGGPGVSDLFGLFTEHGPYIIQADMTAVLRKYHWAKTFHLLYVDNPVGTGYSFTDDERGYVTNQDEMAGDMFEFLQQFFVMFSEYQGNDFYISGESYAGKYVPSLAHKIHDMGSIAKMKLAGIAIGNGMCDPESMMDYGAYLYNIGLVDEHQAKAMNNLSEAIVQNIQDENFLQALIGMEELIIHYSMFPYISLFKNFTGFDYYYNFLLTKRPEGFLYFKKYIETPEFRKAVHIGNLPFQDSKQTIMHLLLDIMKSVKSNVSVIMDNYRVLIYNGQLDIIIPYPLTVNFLKTIKWKKSEEYRNTVRQIWYLRNSTEIAGYVRTVGEFYEVMVRNAGHLLPYDQPEAAFDLIYRFLYKIPYV